MSEGQVSEGNPSGFTRVIDGKDNITFVGYMKDWQIQKGTALVFKNSKYLYSGIFDEDRTDYYVNTKPPKNLKDFKQFSDYVPDIDAV